MTGSRLILFYRQLDDKTGFIGHLIAGRDLSGLLNTANRLRINQRLDGFLDLGDQSHAFELKKSSI